MFVMAALAHEYPFHPSASEVRDLFKVPESQSPWKQLLANDKQEEG